MVCRDVSYIVIKVVENKELGVLIRETIIIKQKRELAIAFVDETEFSLMESNIKIICNKLSIFLLSYIKQLSARYK